MNILQLMKKDEPYLLELASQYFESAIEYVDQGFVSTGPGVENYAQFLFRVTLIPDLGEDTLYIRNVDNLRNAETICNLPVVDPRSVTTLLGKIAATYIIVDFDKYQADVERICFTSPNLLPETKTILLHKLFYHYTRQQNFQNSMMIIKLLDTMQNHFDEIDDLKKILLKEMNQMYFQYNHASYFKTLQQVYHYFQQQKKIQLLQKARMIHDSSYITPIPVRGRQGRQGQADLGDQAPFTIAERDMKLLGPGAFNMRRRVQTGKQLPTIQYASSQTPKQQKIVRQTVKHVTSDLNHDLYKLLMQMVKPPLKQKSKG